MMSSRLTRHRALNITIFTLILLLAAVLRIVHLTQQSLWTDEGFTYNVIVRADMLPEIAADTHPPLYYLLLRGWVFFAGDSVLALRFFSVIPSMLGVALIVPLARALTRGRLLLGAGSVPALAALWQALADSEIFLAQEIRMYTLTTLLAILSMFAYVRWYRSPRRGWAALWLVSTLALVHTYYLGLYVPFIQGLHALIFLRGRVRLSALGILLLSGLLFLPWFLIVTRDQIATPPPSEMFNSQPSNGDTLLELRDKYLTGQWALVTTLLALGVVTLTYRKHPRIHWQPLRQAVLVLMWLLLPVLITFVANLWLPVLTPRKLALIAPAVALLAGWGLANVRQSARRLLVGVVLVYGLATVDFYQLKEPWNQVAANMTRYAQTGDVGLMEVGLGGYPLGYYLDHAWMFSPSGEGTFPARNLQRWRQDAPDTYDAELAAQLELPDTVWLAHWSPERRVFQQLANAGFTQTAQMTTDHLGNDLNVYRFDRFPRAEPVRYTSDMLLLATEFDQAVGLLELWWRANRPLALDYTVSAFVLDENGQLVAQHDSFPFENQRPTSTWRSGEVVYDPHPIDISALPPGRYTLGVKVYTYFDQAIFPTEAGEDYTIVGKFTLP
jgi:hypothetical protein